MLPGTFKLPSHNILQYSYQDSKHLLIYILEATIVKRLVYGHIELYLNASNK